MDSTWIAALVVVGITAAFIYLLSFLHRRASRKDAARRKAQVDTLLSAHQIQLTAQETLRYAFMGMDAVNGKLVYINYYEQDAPVEIIDLKEVRLAKVDVMEYQTYDESRGKTRVADRQTQAVQLVLTSKNGSREKYALPFYQMIYDDLGELAELKQKAARWEQVVNGWIKKS